MVGRSLLVWIALGCGCGGDDDGGSGPGPDASADDPDAGAGVDAMPAEVTITTFVGDQQAPVDFLAAQDGDGPWSVLAGPDGVYTFVAASGRYGIAHVCVYGDDAEIEYFNSTVAETPSPRRTCFGDEAEPVRGSIEVTVANLGTDSANVVVGNNNLGATSGSPTVLHEDLLPGMHDVWVLISSDTSVKEAVIVERVEVTGGQQTDVALDAAADALATTDRTLTVIGAAGEENAGVGARLWSTRGTNLYLKQAGDAYAGVPVAALEEDDIHIISASASDAAAGASRGVQRHVVAPVDADLTLPPPFEPTSVHAAATSPAVRLETTFEPWDGALRYRLDFAQEGGSTYSRWYATGGWVGDGASAAWEQPDLSDLDGWNDAWGMTDDLEVLWLIQVDGGTAPAAVLDAERPLPDLDGLTVTRAEKRGAFVP